MSQLYVVTRTTLVPGFQLAGVEAFGAEDVEAAEELIGAWLDAGETGLLAIDEYLLANMNLSFLKRLRSSETLLHLAIPGGKSFGEVVSRKSRIAQTIRRAVGFQITFRGEETKVEEQ